MRWSLLAVWGLCACQVVGPRPPMVFDGVPTEEISRAQFLMVKGEVLSQQIAVAYPGNVREVGFGSVSAPFVKRDGDHLVLESPEGRILAPISEVTSVTFSAPQIRGWSQARRATTWGAVAGGLVGGGLTLALVANTGDMSLEDLPALVILGPLATGFYASLGGGVGFVVGSLMSGDVTLSTEDGWTPAVPPAQAK